MSVNGSIFEMHQLVLFSIRQWLEPHKELVDTLLERGIRWVWDWTAEVDVVGRHHEDKHCPAVGHIRKVWC